MYLQCETDYSTEKFGLTMSIRGNYTRFLFFFIIYLGINLLIIKIRKSDYIYDNVVNILKTHKDVLPSKRGFYEDNMIDRKENGIVSVITRKFENIPDDQKETINTMKQILETCEENNITATYLTRRHFLYSSAHNGLYCWIRKAGSTTLTKLFSDMNGRVKTRNYYREIQFLAPKTEDLFRKILGNSEVFKLLIVRHPFERLVSAYRDRIEDNSRYTAQSWIYVPKIFHVTRPELFDSPGTLDVSLIKIFHADKRLRIIPSFEEFVKWLLQQDSTKDDPHWNQYYRHCALCSVKYDFVLKLENYTQNDIDYIFKRLKLDRNITYFPKLEETRDGNTNFEQTCNYFQNLSHEAVVNLYEKYRIDFEMFNYEFDKYFECTGGD